MLTQLDIRNYALITKSVIHFREGFSVITGETGAGKSILLGALGLLQGKRADSKVIKIGEQKCTVEAVFSLKHQNLASFFEDNDIDFDGDECIIRREVTATGKSRAFINDTPVGLGVLKTLSEQIFDIHSQHQNLLFAHENFLIETIDSKGSLQQEVEQFAANYHCWTRKEKEINSLKAQAEKDKEDAEFISFQLQTLEEAQLKPGEQEELEKEAEWLDHAGEIKQALLEANELLYESDHNLISQLKQCARLLSHVATHHEDIEAEANRLESVYIECEDIASELERMASKTDFDPKRSACIHERLDHIYALEQKHHVNSVDELIDLQKRYAERLNLIENFDDAIAEKEKELALLWQQLEKEGKALTEKRKKAAADLEKGLISQLKELGMPAVQLAFHFEEKARPDASGFDTLTFLFSANKNVPPQDVAQIASGGEIARLMLSLKAQIAQSSKLPTILFDEIDTGVSGTMAEKMARVMRQMSDHCQVITITHLPQIAALGSTHYRVEKSQEGESTESRIITLQSEERVTEIAHMLSGETLTNAAINNAKALLDIPNQL